MKTPFFDRLLLGVYPRWFLGEYGDELRRHLALQRAEPRYRGALGTLRFWVEAGLDGCATALQLRMEGRREARKRTRGGGVGGMTDGIGRDLRYALRGLVKNPGYALVFIVTLGLGIGANTAIFSAVHGVLLRPLPHEDGDRLVYLRQAAPLADLDNVLFSVPEIEDYRTGVATLDEIAEFSAMTFTMLGYEQPRRVRAGIVTGNYFDVMGLSSALGRTVGPEDDGEDAPAVIALSHRYWQNVFGGDPDVLGRTVEMNGRTATIVGVAEPAPPYPERTDIYVNMAASPHHLEATMQTDRVHRMTEVFARLAPGATVESARTQIEGVTSRLHGDHPDVYDTGSGFTVGVTPLKTQLTARARPTLLLLFGTAILVLVIACANLANLTLTRVLRRDHELAVRVSLGGSRGTLRRELLVESLVLAALGAAVGLVIAFVSLDLLVSFASRFTSRATEIAFDGTVFVFALLVMVGASVFFTVLPPLPDGNDVGSALSRGGRGSTGGSGARRTQRGLVVAQIATSFVLLIGAGLFLRSMLNLNRVDPGFETERVLTMDIPAASLFVDLADLRTQHLSTLDDVRALPGVRSAAMTNSVPLAGNRTFASQWRIEVENHEPSSGAPTPRAEFRVATPGYFETMGIEVVRGRTFTTTDTEDAQPVAILNESMARAYFGDEDPIGKRIAWTDEVIRFIGLHGEYRTVVGVVEDTRDWGLDARVQHAMYNPYGQVTPFFSQSLVLRSAGDPRALLPAVRDIVLSYDPNQPIDNIATIQQLGERSIAPVRLNTILLGAFAALALVIAAVGIGGVLAFSVGSRRREFGIRTALGALRHQVWSEVLVEGAWMAGAGVVIGALLSLVLTRFLGGLLVGVPAFDPVTFVAVGLLLAAVAILASWIPAWRAATVSPMEVLESE